jgi:hypothetical protein
MRYAGEKAWKNSIILVNCICGTRFASVLYSKPAWSRAYDKGKCNVKFKKGKMKGSLGFRRRQEFMKPSHFFIPTGSVSDPDPHWIRIQ